MSIFDKKIDRVQKFEKVSEGKTEEEKRDLEEILLKPEPLPIYDGPQPEHKSELESRTALIVFRNKHQMDLIGELFQIRTSIGKVSYITDISLLEGIAKMVKAGRAVINGDSVELVPEKSDSDRPTGRLRRKLS
jgi:hypothetical protein